MRDCIKSFGNNLCVKFLSFFIFCATHSFSANATETQLLNNSFTRSLLGKSSGQ
jgi:hypothetical protein